MTALLAAEGVHARHPGATYDALRDLTLGVAAGEILVLVGPNGSGKSTALAVLGRALRPQRGVVRLDGVDLRCVGRRQLARRVARLPQDPACPEGLTVEQLTSCGRHPHRRFLAGIDAGERAIVREALGAVDVLDLRGRRVETLSGGERRRVWLAMLLAQQAEVLLLDEPTAALDLRHQHEVLALLARLRVERGATLVVVLHDLAQAAAIADRIAVMQHGRLYDVGPPADCVRPAMLHDVFGIAAEVRAEDGRLQVVVRGPAQRG
jgi:iron complex transport system ATP-binding protein